MSEQNRLTNGRRILECIAKDYAMPENADQRKEVDYYATHLAYCCGGDRHNTAVLLRHYRMMRKEFMKHDYSKK